MVVNFEFNNGSVYYSVYQGFYWYKKFPLLQTTNLNSTLISTRSAETGKQSRVRALHLANNSLSINVTSN